LGAEDTALDEVAADLAAGVLDGDTIESRWLKIIGLDAAAMLRRDTTHVARQAAIDKTRSILRGR